MFVEPEALLKLVVAEDVSLPPDKHLRVRDARMVHTVATSLCDDQHQARPVTVLYSYCYSLRQKRRDT